MTRGSWLGLVASFALAGTAAAVAGSGSANVPVTPYVEVSDNASAGVLHQVASQTHVHSAVVGFIVADGRRCVPAWDGAGPVAKRPFAAQIKALRGTGVTPVLSVGGQGGRELATVCRTPRALASAYRSAIQAYGVRALDLDLEGRALAPAAVARRAAALALLQRSDPRLALWLTLPVSTNGMPGDAVAAVRAATAAGVRLAGVNVMAMDFGNSDAPNPAGRMAMYVERAATAAHRQLGRIAHGLGAWGRLAVTVMIGRNDTRSEVVTLNDASALARFAAAHRLAGLRYWSFNRDRACSRQDNSVSDNCSGVSQSPGAFGAALARRSA